MKIAWSILAGDARGKLGQVAATLTRSGPMLRRMVRPRQPNSQTQLAMRAALGTLSQLWRSSSMATKRADWVLLAYNNPEKDVFNNYIKKTGLNWFNRCNRNLELLGENDILTAPAFDTINSPGTLTLTHVTSPSEQFTIGASVPPTGANAVIIAATRGISPGILKLSNQQRQVLIVNPSTAGPWDILAAYTAKFGDPVPDKQIFVQVHYIQISSGIPGPTAQEALVW
jgi:hypothetical protein